MKKIGASFLFILILFSLSVSEIFACTTFCLKSKGEVLFGRNYDWMIGDGLVFVNKRGLAKQSSGENNPAKWTAKYGSVTFNQYGRENPMGGMNEAGLVVELMWLDEARYPKADSRPTLDTLEWIQYQLDISSTVAEVIENSEKVRIDAPVPLHYLVGDREGNSATIEFLNGKLVAHTGENLPVSTLTNDTYEKSLNYSKSVAIEKARSESSLDRFTRAAVKTKEFEKQPRTEQESVNYAFDILADVAQKNATQWSIVYDQKRGKIHFRSLQSPAIKTIDTKNFDYVCGSAVRMFDINKQESGDVGGKFIDYTRKANRDLIERSFSGTDFLKNIPAASREALAQFPESFVCETDTQKRTASAQSEDRPSISNFWFAVMYYAARQFLKV